MLIWAAVFLAVSCGTQRKALDTETRDSTRVVVRTERIETIDTVYVEIPRQSENVVVKDTISHLENDISVSEARIDTLGFLHHTLETKITKLPVPVKTTHEKKDSVSSSSTSKKEVVKVFVEKDLTGWQKFRLKSWWWLVGLLALVLAKKIYPIVRRFI